MMKLRGSAGSASRVATSAGEYWSRTGETGPGLMLVLSGRVEVTAANGDERQQIVTHERGNFMGELAQLSGRPYLVDEQALTDVEAVAIPPDRLRALLIAEADLGERMMRALILRRVGLIEAGAGPVIVGDEANARRAAPGQFPAPQRPSVSAARSRQTTAARRHWSSGSRSTPEELPIVLCPSGQLLRNPTEGQLARCVGLVGPVDADKLYDVVVIGAGPAGLATSVYAAFGRACRCLPSIAARSADRRAPPRGSKIISASRPASPAWR